MTHLYASKSYAETLSHLGEPFFVPEWGCHVLLREIEPGLKDAMGTYPLAILAEDADIQGGLERLKERGIISIVLVLDAFHGPAHTEFEKYFTFIRPFKHHFVRRGRGTLVSYNRYHRHKLQKALKRVQAMPIDLKNNMESWLALYSNLIAHRNLAGGHVFPAAHYTMLAKSESVKAIGAWMDDMLVSCHIWVTDGRYVHSHLVASSMDGYRASAAYAVNDASLHYFKDAEIINFGGGAGYASDENDGLAKFKQGFSNDTVSSFLCGAILDNKRYMELAQKAGQTEENTFFPAYRQPKIAALQ